MSTPTRRGLPPLGDLVPREERAAPPSSPDDANRRLEARVSALEHEVDALRGGRSSLERDMDALRGLVDAATRKLGKFRRYFAAWINDTNE